MWSRTRVLLSCLVLMALLHVQHTWRHDRRPRVYGDKVPRKVLLPSLRRVQRKIVTYHNFFRTQVSPPAADMLRMTWHAGAARSAQKWSDRCLYLQHDDVDGRYNEEFGTCGQNIFISTQKVPWFFAIKTWFLERDNFTYGSSSRNNLFVIGHYTQMVWAATHRVGCGFTRCHSRGREYYSYICNYCPMGNYLDRLGLPYKRGQPCAKCQAHCRMGKLCTNSCHTADQWANCRELNSTWHSWLCDNHSPDGRQRHRACRATCNCHDKITN